jgi:hypothetical protein
MKNTSFEYQKADWKQVSPVCATVSHTFTLQEPVKGTVLQDLHRKLYNIVQTWLDWNKV